MKTLFTLSLTILSLGLFGQVGINTTTPSQTLDVNGQIQIGEDANLPDEEGAIRYNSDTNDFEGRNNIGWQSLTNSGARQIPEGAQHVYFTALVSNSPRNLEFRYSEDYTSATPAGIIPVDKYLIITSVNISINATATLPAAEEYYAIRIWSTLGATTSPLIYFGGKYSHGPLVNIHGFNPICIFPPGATASLRYESRSTTIQDYQIAMSGFLVDDLSYD